MNIIKFLLSIVLLAVLSGAVADEQQVVNNLRSLFPGTDITQVNPSPIQGIYEVIIGSDVIYVTGDARFILKGDLIDTQEKSNLSDNLRAKSRAALLSAIPENEYVEFPAKQSQDVIYVFTDVDCGYCRKLHMDVDKLNDAGISVRYLAYPRAGLESPTYATMESIWCAEDRPTALTDAKLNRPVQANNCDNPIAEQYALGQQMGVRGTPAIFLENGVSLPGYLPPNTILQALGR